MPHYEVTWIVVLGPVEAETEEEAVEEARTQLLAMNSFDAVAAFYQAVQDGDPAEVYEVDLDGNRP